MESPSAAAFPAPFAAAPFASAPFTQFSGGLGGAQMPSQFMPQMSPDAPRIGSFGVREMEQQSPLSGLASMAPNRFDLSQLRPEARQISPESSEFQTYSPLGLISGLTALLRGRG
jgi:hypothetical protein